MRVLYGLDLQNVDLKWHKRNTKLHIDWSCLGGWRGSFMSLHKNKIKSFRPCSIYYSCTAPTIKTNIYFSWIMWFFCIFLISSLKVKLTSFWPVLTSQQILLLTNRDELDPIQSVACPVCLCQRHCSFII